MFIELCHILSKYDKMIYIDISLKEWKAGGTMGIRDLLMDILSNYHSEKEQGKFGKDHRMYKLLNYDSKTILSERLDNHNLGVRGSAGQGNWATYPWIAIFNGKVTNTIQEGVYIVYLFSNDMTRVYLTLNQGCTNLKKTLGQKKAREKMVEIREEIRNRIHIDGFNTANDLMIGNKDYEVGSIFYKLYTKEDMPLEEQLQSDLDNLLQAYDQYYREIFLGTSQEEREIGDMVEYPSNKQETIQRVRDYLEAKGFIYSYEDVANFYLSLKTKPFVILAGISGTGKSKLVRLFAEALGATAENGRYCMISVKPDWNDNTELIGYKNIAGDFIPGALVKVVKEAAENLDKPYFVCLDEMNLARVEYYLSDYLSLIESREQIDDEIITDPVFNKGYFLGESEYEALYIPENLYIIGTVNMDDTTFAFSRKVLDRANTIEFSQVFLESLEFSNIVSSVLELDNTFLKTTFLNIKQALHQDEGYVKTLNTKVIEINEILKSGNKHFGYRVRDEIIFYMLENKIAGLLDEDTAMDYQMMQKILPTISGSDRRIKEILIRLYNICNVSKPIYDSPNYLEDAENFMDQARYQRSAQKIIEMLRGYSDGFTSYWA